MALQLSTDSDFSQRLAEKPVVVVKYFADWCGNCKLIAPKVRRLSEEEGNADVLFLDVNAEENPEARKAAGVDNLPFFAVFKNGELAEGLASSKIEVVSDLLNRNR